MANEALVSILKQGTLAWNTWREQHPEIVSPDLTRCDLSNLNLVGADLSRADLTHAQLSKANLRRANFEEADLIYADLCQVDLREATLHKATVMYASLDGADLSDANLNHASLIESDFVGAKFCRTDLHNANLTGSALLGTHFLGTEVSGVDFTDTIMGQTMLVSTDFSKAGGFHSIVHRSPSHISISTLLVSRAVLPVVFLRGIGLPEFFIQFLQTLPAHTNGFLCGYVIHSQWDTNFAQRLYADLQQFGMRCWLLEYSVNAQGKWLQSDDDTYITNMMHRDDLFVLLCTQHTVESSWLQPLLHMVRQREANVGHPLLIVCQMDTSLALMGNPQVVELKNNYPVIDFTQWQNKEGYEDSLLQLLTVLQAKSTV